MFDYESLIKALRCDGFIGGACHRDCKHRENGLCELSHSELNKKAADAIEQLLSENNRITPTKFRRI